MSILVVDDQVLNRIALSRVLEKYNFCILHASDGFEGLQLFLQHHASLRMVFMDLMMPELDGWATALKMRCLEDECDWVSLPIVGFTSEDFSLGSPVWVQCMDSGMDDVVAKPLNQQQTQRLLSKFIPDWYLAQPAVQHSLSSASSWMTGVGPEWYDPKVAPVSSVDLYIGKASPSPFNTSILYNRSGGASNEGTVQQASEPDTPSLLSAASAFGALPWEEGQGSSSASSLNLDVP